MKDKATFQNKVKVLNKLFDSGCDTEKKLQQLDMEAILKIPNITIPDMEWIRFRCAEYHTGGSRRMASSD